MKLTPYQRLNLMNQFLILKHLEEIKPAEGNSHYYDSEYFDNYVTILSRGYEGYYGEIFNDVNEETYISKENSDFVNDVLFMYDRGYLSYQDLKDNEKEEFKLSKLKFLGFDGNEEIDYYAICNFMVNNLKQWQYVLFSKNGSYGIDVNSHMNRVSKYQRMLEKFDKYKHANGGILSLDELKEVFY